MCDALFVFACFDGTLCLEYSICQFVSQQNIVMCDVLFALFVYECDARARGGGGRDAKVRVRARGIARALIKSLAP